MKDDKDDWGGGAFWKGGGQDEMRAEPLGSLSESLYLRPLILNS